MSTTALFERVRAGLEQHARRGIELPEGRCTFGELKGEVERFAAALGRIGIESGHRVAIQGANGLWWIAADLALLRIGAVSVALPEDTVLERSSDLAERYGLSLWLGSAEARQLYREPGSFMSTFDDLLSGRAERRRTSIRTEDSDLLGIIHSSGTSHRKAMWVSARGTSSFLDAFSSRYPVDDTDRLIVFMPLASYQQRKMVYGCALAGTEMVFSPPVSLFSAFAASRPTIVIGPPSLFETAEVLARASSGGLASVFGGRARRLLSGMAKIQPDTVASYHRQGLELYEVYGLNESGVVSGNHREAHRPGSVGRPLDGTRVRIAPDGEIVVEKQRPVCAGYFDRPEDQEDTRLEGNIVYTGDLGRVDDDGYVFVTGRKKTTLVLRDGRKVQPEPVEKELERLEGIAHAVLFANPQRTGILVVVDLRGHAGSDELERVQRAAEEIVTGCPLSVRVAPAPFSVENGCLSRVLKVNRSRIWRDLTEKETVP